jgi:two-component system phosphate regulon sensor histidine kinase PhoR
MLYLFNDLLQLSVIESKYKLEKEKVNLTELIQETLLSVQGIYHDKKIQVIMNLEQNEISVDPKLFDQVFMNLIDNACKYSGGNPVIEISSILINEGVKITISDNGPGILPDHLKRIFERFYRIDSSRDREQGGTGLGLAIVKHIIQKHNGKISAESNGKDGTTFIIEVPQN